MFYNRTKIRLGDLRAIRVEMGLAYRAATRQELDWADLRAAIAALVAMANIDQGFGTDERLDEIEARLASIKPNGHAVNGRVAHR